MKKKIAYMFIALVIGVLITPVTVAAQQVDYCEADFDFDGDVDAPDVATFLTDFGRSRFNNPCPFTGPSPLQRTGQIDQFSAGDDGDFSMGVPWPVPRFIDPGDGTVKDTLTGLVWLKNASCFGLKPWLEALTDCSGLEDGQCGLTDGSSPGDWRLPNVNQLLSLVDRSNDSPALPESHPFTNLESSYYWSSTTAAYDTSYAWFVYLADGFSDFELKSTAAFFVWPVKNDNYR